MHYSRKLIFCLITVLCFFLKAGPAKAYSVLSHEAIVDASWEKSILPLLKWKYPGLTDSSLSRAHAYAYGGSIAPDMGYFPFGSRLFTDLVHYVRSGDFVHSLLQEASDVNEYAFALGFLCHYMADKHGHLLGTNPAVPIVYPKMKEKFGDRVTYEEDRNSHRQLEFAFDVLQVAKGNYASRSYHDFIGFQVSEPVLEKAFLKTYGLDIHSVFRSLSISIESFRWSVRGIFPALTRAAWVTKKNEIRKSQPTATSRNFRYKMKRANYYQDFGKKQKKPGILATSLGWFIRVLPKVGPLKPLKLKAPGPAAEKLFIQSFDTTLLYVSSAMSRIKAGKLELANIDYDTGLRTERGEYDMADGTYDELIRKLAANKFQHLSPELKQVLLTFYQTNPPIRKKKVKVKHCDEVTAALHQLKNRQEP